MVDNNFLPIGTICKLKNSNIKIMITGFLPASVSGSVNVFDYIGYVYPKGTLDGESFYFNKDEIIEVIYEGYKSEEHNNLVKVLERYKGNNVSNIENAVTPDFKIKFDSEGMVIDDGIKETVNQIITEPQKVDDTAPKFEFDANGYVVKANEDNLNNPFKVEENVSEIKPSADNWDIFKEIKFDTNGMVIADGLEHAVNIPETVINGENIKSSGIKFDANGIVIDDGLNVQDINNSSIKFDSNGMVIADGNNIFEQENKATGGFKFDANGTVIAE